jgi:hypothetical protein
MQYSRRRFLSSAAAGAAGLSWPGAALATVSHTLRKPTLFELLARSGTVMRRREWTRARPDTRRLQRAAVFSSLTVHHSGAGPNSRTEANEVAADLQNILAGHLKRHYGDIGYHFVIDYAGRVWEGRPLMYEGAHVCRHNAGNIGVMLLGNFEQQRPSAVQVRAMVRTIRILRGWCWIGRRRVYGHRDLGSSLCPGRHLYPHVTRLRA